MSPDTPLDDEVRVLDVEPSRRGRWPLVLGVVLILALAGGGAWVVLTDPFGGAPLEAAPAAAADNLLGEAWSFETTETASPGGSWLVIEGAPAGFAFDERGAVSGATGASAIPSDAGWARVVSAVSERIDSPSDAVEIAAVSGSENVQLFLRFEASDRQPLDLTVASGAGAIAGRVHPPPGYTHVRAGLGAVGEGSLDDVALRFVSGDDRPPALRRGVFEVVKLPHGLMILAGDMLVFHMEGLTVAGADGVYLPGAVAAFPGQQAVALPDGRRLSATTDIQVDERRIVLGGHVEGLPPGGRVLNTGRVLGPLAAQPFGIGSATGYEIFTDDFRVEQASALVLGRTQDRLLLRGNQTVMAGTWQADDTVSLSLAWPVGSGQVGPFELQTSFQQERVEARQLLDRAVDAEGSGRIGDALATAELILTEYPYDEEVLATAAGIRSRIQVQMQDRLDHIEAALDDALFLASAARCREVLSDCLAAAERFAGSEAEARFREMGATVKARAAELLEEDRARRAARLRAVMDSFESAGGYDLVVDELRRYIDQHLSGGEGGS